MHLILPFAAAQSNTGRHALQTLRLPQLNALLPRLSATRRDNGQPLAGWAVVPLSFDLQT